MDMRNILPVKRQHVAKEESSRVIGTDRFSNIREVIILHILSFLPTEKTIATGVLARSWKNLWKEVQHLKFDDKYHKNRFSDHVINSLISYQNRFFESLTIGVSNDCDSTELAIWLGIALTKNVLKLVLKLNEYGHPVTFPQRSLKRTNTLKILKLVQNIHFDIPDDSVSLHFLKELHLYHVSFDNEVSVVRLLHGCPILEDLVLELFLRSGINTLIINVPSLLRLKFPTHFCIQENIILQTPRLKYLNTKRLDSVVSFKMQDVTKMTEAIITCHVYHIDENILSSMTSVQHHSLTAPLKVSIDHFKFTYPFILKLPDLYFNNTHDLLPNKHSTGKIFDYLTSLETDTKPDAWCILLSYMLTCSPNLQLLKFAGGKYTRLATEWIEPEDAATGLLTHLHTIVCERYTWDGRNERAVATYVLKNAPILKDATFTILESTNDTDIIQRQAMLTELGNVERASPSCIFLVKEISLLQRNFNSTHDPDVGPFRFAMIEF